MIHDSGLQPIVSNDVAWVVIDNEVVVYEPTGPAVHLLSPTASLIWQCFDGTTTISELARDLATAFQRSPDAVEADVLAFTLEMLSLRLLANRDPDVESTPR